MEVNLETTGKLREYILNIQKPAVLKNILNSQLISWDLDQWQKELGSDLLKFRCGRNQFTQNPQWESTCSTKYSNFTEFLESAKSNSHEWWYFDYKHLNQWLLNKENIQNNITWTNLGFPELNQSHSTIWIGSKGAHTPCHVDTYGCNIVLQVFGRKQWLLFPPEENLKPARIPFEESSIYSKLNFFSPQINKFKGVFHCHKVTLNPGEILVVPNKWWHYVENLETAISVNAWIPLPQDDFERVKEGIASIFIGKALEHKNQMKEILLNPNMVEDIVNCNDALKIIRATRAKRHSDHKRNKPNEFSTAQPFRSDLKQISVDICEVPVLSDIQFKDLLVSQAERFENIEESKLPQNEDEEIVHFLNVITNDEVLSLIAKKMMEDL